MARQMPLLPPGIPAAPWPSVWLALGRIKGVKRPALCAIFPVKDGQAVVTDVGANAICKPEFLLQFAIMGSIYAQSSSQSTESPGWLDLQW